MIIHKSVLLEEVINQLRDYHKVVFDGTVGHGGHLEALINKNNYIDAYGLDIDSRMLLKAQDRLSIIGNKINKIPKLYKSNYSQIDTIMTQNNLSGIDFVLLDIGVNMDHFKDVERGFSIKGDAKLDMRFDIQSSNNGYDLINNYNINKLVNVFVNYAEFSESKSIEIANLIKQQRKIKPIKTTIELKEILKECGLGEKACAVIFQAIRIEINGELNNLTDFIDKLPKILNSKGVCGIISFHSLEDRIVKNKFKEMSDKGFKIINKKVIIPNYKEVQKNKASRSAKLRFIEKL